jgi:hypothetical protein
MITHQRNVYSWEFIFLAANQDAFAVSESMGISKGNALNFAATPAGTHGLYKKMSKAVAHYRSLADDVDTSRLMADLTDDSTEPAKPDQ